MAGGSAVVGRAPSRPHWLARGSRRSKPLTVGRDCAKRPRQVAVSALYRSASTSRSGGSSSLPQASACTGVHRIFLTFCGFRRRMRAAYHDPHGERQMLGSHGRASQHVRERSGADRRAQIGRPGESAEHFFVGRPIFVPGSVNEAGVEAEAAGNDSESDIRPMPDREAEIRPVGRAQAGAMGWVSATVARAERAVTERGIGLAGLSQDDDGEGELGDELSAGARSAWLSTGRAGRRRGPGCWRQGRRNCASDCNSGGRDGDDVRRRRAVAGGLIFCYRERTGAFDDGASTGPKHRMSRRRRDGAGS